MRGPWTPVDLPLAVGLNTRDDGKLLPPARLLDVQNAVFGKGGALRKRNGSDDLSRSTLAVIPATIAAAKQLATRGDELALLDGTSLYSYSPAATAWADRGDLLALEARVDTVADSPDAQTSPDCATADGITVYAWEDVSSSPDTVHYAVYDSVSGAVLQPPSQLASNADRPRVLALGDTVLVLYHDLGGNDLLVKRIVAADLANTLAAPVISFGYSDIHDSTGLDAVSMGTYAVWCCRTAANAVRVGTVLPTGALGGPGSGHGYAADANTVDTDIMSIHVSGSWGIVCYASGSDLYFANVSDMVTAGGGPVVMDAGTVLSTDLPSRVSCLSGGAEDSGHVWWDVSSVVKYGLIASGAITTTSSLRRSRLGSHAFFVGSTPYVHVHHNSTLQGTYLLVDTEGYPQARVLGGTGYGPFTAHLPRVTSPEADVYEWAGTFKHRLSALDDSVYTQPGIAHVSYDLGSAHMLSRCDRRGTLYLGAGLVWEYDGESPVESGFLLFPEGVTGVPANGSGSLEDTGNNHYFYTAYWEWYNTRGERTQSTTAAVLDVTMAVGDDEILVTVPSLPYTWRRGSRSAPVLALYRSASDGTTRHRVTSLDPTDAGLAANGYVVNDPTSDTVTLLDRMSDADLVSKELDYLNGSGVTELDNVAPPPLRGLRQVQGRVWGVSADDRRRVYYSKLSKDETSVEWNDGLYIDLPYDVAGIADVVGRPVFLCEDSIYTVDGEGPDNLGIGAYSRPELVNNDVGLHVPRTLVQTPRGWMFQSRKGFWLLGNSLREVVFIGSDVNAYNGQAFTGAELVADTNQVRFLTSSGRTLVYDYERNLWGTFTRHEGTASAVWRGTYCYASAAGLVRVEADHFRDSGNAIALGLTTAWFKPGDSVQGFGRIRAVYVLGTHKSVHRLRVEVGYDYEDEWRETFEIDPTDFIESATWGDSGTWGGDAVWGGSGNTTVYQARRGLIRQKCQAVRFRITEETTEDAGEGLELNLLTLLVARKGGANRLPENRTI